MLGLLINPLLRGIAQGIAGILVAKGITDDSTEVVAGVILGVLTLVWSIIEKRMAKAKLEEAIQSPAGFATRDAAAKAGVDVEGNGAQKIGVGYASPVMNAKKGK